MRLPALIQTADAKHCSPDCQFQHFGNCVARGNQAGRIEQLDKDGELYSRTEYCVRKAFENTRIEKCPKCKGKFEGETYSARTKCNDCGARFVRITDQDETYLTDADEFDKKEREEFEKQFEKYRTK